MNIYSKIYIKKAESIRSSTNIHDTSANHYFNSLQKVIFLILYDLKTELVGYGLHFHMNFYVHPKP